MKVKTILVLGGAGYIGSHTVYELIDNGYDVVVADNMETGFRAAVHPKARFYQGDIRNKEFCDHVFSSEKIDAVIHFAANSQVGESMVDPLKYYDNNLGGTRTMLQSMIEHGVKYIVFSSTAATYGEPERVPILETDPTHPTNCYGETKLSMERMFYWASVAHGIHFVALRYFNACGAHMSGKIGEAHGKSVAQVILRWLTQRDIIALPKSTHKERMEENLNIFDFQLSDDEMATIAGLDTKTSMFFRHDTPDAVDRFVGYVKDRAGRE